MQSTGRQARDEWLALGCQQGRPEAFERLIGEMERPLLYYVAKLLRDDERALDVLQQIWLRVLRSIRRLEDARRLRPWLYRIAHGLVVDRIRHDASRAQAGKFCAIYPPDVGSARRLMDRLAVELKDEVGPYILTDRRYGDKGVVHYRYGA